MAKQKRAAAKSQPNVQRTSAGENVNKDDRSPPQSSQPTSRPWGPPPTSWSGYPPQPFWPGYPPPLDWSGCLPPRYLSWLSDYATPQFLVYGRPARYSGRGLNSWWVWPPTHSTFQRGDRVRKTEGSRRQGRVVGWYATELTPEGYAVESETETGSVQIYPAAALEAL